MLQVRQPMSLRSRELGFGKWPPPARGPCFELFKDKVGGIAGLRGIHVAQQQEAAGAALSAAIHVHAHNGGTAGGNDADEVLEGRHGGYPSAGEHCGKVDAVLASFKVGDDVATIHNAGIDEGVSAAAAGDDVPALEAGDDVADIVAITAVAVMDAQSRESRGY